MAGGDPFEVEGVAWVRLGPGLTKARRVAGAVVVALVLLVMLAALLVWPEQAEWWGGLALAVVLAFVAAWPLVARTVRSWGYAERADDLLVRHGVLVRRLAVVPYGRMQFIDVTAGPIDRRLGMATVRLHTAAAASDAGIPGLPADEAARLRDRLAELGEARAAGL